MLLDGQLKEGFGIHLSALPENDQYGMAWQCYKNDWSIRKLQKEIQYFQESIKNKNIGQLKQQDSDIVRLQNKLSEEFGTQVVVQHDHKMKKGKVIIAYDSMEIMDGLLDKWLINLND